MDALINYIHKYEEEERRVKYMWARMKRFEYVLSDEAPSYYKGKDTEWKYKLMHKCLINIYYYRRKKRDTYYACKNLLKIKVWLHNKNILANRGMLPIPF